MVRSPKGVLFVGGNGPAAGYVRRALQAAEMIIAADSGYDLARSMDVEPDFLVGDMDSIAAVPEEDAFPADRVLAYDREKDETDTEIGLRILHERGISDITIVGGGGGRLDHLMGILALFERDIRPSCWLTEHEEVVHIEGDAVFDKMQGVVCSFFPVGEDVATMRTSGLRWPLDELAWRHGDAGVSNYGVEDRVTVSMRSGRLIMVRSLPEVGGA